MLSFPRSQTSEINFEPGDRILMSEFDRETNPLEFVVLDFNPSSEFELTLQLVEDSNSKYKAQIQSNNFLILQGGDRLYQFKKIENSPFLVDTSLEFVDPNITATISQLPDDLVYEFSQRLSLNDLFALCQTSARFNRLICGVQLPNQVMSERDQQRSKLFWSQILRRDYPETLDYLPIDTDPRKVLRFFDRSQKNQIKPQKSLEIGKILIRVGDSVFFRIEFSPIRKIENLNAELLSFRIKSYLNPNDVEIIEKINKIENELFKNLEELRDKKYTVTSIDPFSFYPKTRYIIMDPEGRKHELIGDPFLFDKIPIPNYLGFKIEQNQKTKFIMMYYFPVHLQYRNDITFIKVSEKPVDGVKISKINENKYEYNAQTIDNPKFWKNPIIFTLIYYNAQEFTPKASFSKMGVEVLANKKYSYNKRSFGKLYPETILQIKKDIDFVFLSHLPEINRNLLWLKTQPWIGLENLSPEQMISELRELGWL